MTRRHAERPPRRLLRTRPAPHRPEHGLDLALVEPHPFAAQRADQRALRALAEENALLARELGRVQARCTQWRQDCIAQAERLEGLLIRARGELVAKETQIDALREMLVPATAPPSPLAARRVLCVGGRARQIPVYRELVERGGGRLDHVDGADPACLPRLRLSLAHADLVILQPGYVCQGACRIVEQHCARTGVRCVQLDKACALGFARSLAEAMATAGGCGPNPDHRDAGNPAATR